MSKKTLFLLVILLVLLLGVWKFHSRLPAAPGSVAAEGDGTLLGTVDMSTVAAITLEGVGATTHLARVEGDWRVAEKDDYPADFDRLRELIRSIDDMEAGQVIPAGTEHLAEFGLVGDETSTPTRVTMQHAAGQTVLLIGDRRAPNPSEPYWGRVPGRYVRVDEGPVRLLKEDIRMAEADPDGWWDRSLLKLVAEDIQRIDVATGIETYAIERGEDQVLQWADDDEGEEMDSNAVNRIFGALRGLRADAILPKDAEFEGVSHLDARVAGVTYSLHIGEARSEHNRARPIQITVTAADDVAPDVAADALRQSKLLTGKTYLIPSYQTDQLLPAKSTLIPPPPASEPPVPVEEEVVGGTEEGEEAEAVDATDAEVEEVPAETEEAADTEEATDAS